MNNDEKLPQQGEITKQQSPTYGGLAGIVHFGAGYDFGIPDPSTYSTYRKMRRNPTIALARSVATAPLRTSSYNIVPNKDVPDDIVNFITEQVDSFWPEFLRNLLYALDYGWQPFEKVWEIKEGKLVYRKLKPLLVDKTEPLFTKEGMFAGLKQDNISLPVQNSYVFTNDQECDNLYGRSRNENIRETAWFNWEQTMKRSAVYQTKIAGVIPALKYPPGSSLDSKGQTKENFDVAVSALAALGRGNGFIYPDVPPKWIGDNLDALLRSDVDVSKLKAWELTFYEPGTDHAQGFNTSLRHLESLMMRGWLVPERVATEGQMGTKAESETQTDTAIAISYILFDDILRSANWHIINPLLSYNFGPQYENKVKIKKGGLTTELQTFYRNVMTRVLSEPMNLGLFMKWTQIDDLLEKIQWPKNKDIVSGDNEQDPMLIEKVNKMIEDMKKGQADGSNNTKPVG